MGKYHENPDPAVALPDSDDKVKLRDIPPQEGRAQSAATNAKEKKQANQSMHDQFNEARLAKGEAVYPSSGQANATQ